MNETENKENWVYWANDKDELRYGILLGIHLVLTCEKPIPKDLPSNALYFREEDAVALVKSDSKILKIPSSEINFMLG